MERNESHPVGTEASDPVRVECYARSDVSTVGRRQITAVRDRLGTLRDTSLVADVEMRQWPQPADVVGDVGATEKTRSDLVGEFDDWAAEQGYSLRPAFRRRTVPGSLVGPDEPTEEIRVPIVALALRAPDGERLRGVVPYTVDPGRDDARTYTVDDWLTAAEEATAARASGPVTSSGPSAESD